MPTSPGGFNTYHAFIRTKADRYSKAGWFRADDSPARGLEEAKRRADALSREGHDAVVMESAHDRIGHVRERKIVYRSRAKPRHYAERDVALDKKALWKEIDQDQRRKDREKVAAMRQHIREQRAAWPAARAAAKTSCRSETETTRSKAHEVRSRHKEEARREIATLRSDARTRCATGRHAPRLAIDALREKLAEERKHQRQLRAIARSNRSRALAKSRPGIAKAREALGENDDEVRSNIPPDLIPLFEKVKRTIKGTPRKSRTEAFLEYVEEHPGEEYAAVEDKTEALVRELERQQRSGRRDPKQLRMFGEAGHGQLDLYSKSDPNVSVVYLDHGVRTIKRLRRSEARSFLKGLPKSAWTRETAAVARALGVGGRRDPARDRRCTRGLQVQTLIFPKSRFTRAQALSWARSQGMRTTKVDETGTSYRIRQRPPEHLTHGSLRTIPMGRHGVQAVVGCPKRASS